MNNPLLGESYNDQNQLIGSNRFIVPFMACGDLNGFDSDATYSLNIDGITKKFTSTAIIFNCFKNIYHFY